MTETNKWLITVSVLTGTIMAVLDTSIVNVALPHMRGTLNATVEQIAWVATGYILSSVIVMPITGLLSERFGRKNFLLAMVVLFTTTSMLCGIARSLGTMIAFRVAQGIGGGAIITVSQAILREAFPHEEQGLAMGLYGMGVVLAPAFGPTLGGWLTDHYSWPWIFYINVPIGVVNVLLVTRFIHDPHYLERHRGRIDVPGLALLGIGLGAIQIMLEEGPRNDWWASTFITSLAVVGAAGMALFVWRELVADRPAVDLRLFKNVSFASATSIGGILGLGLYGSLFLLPLFLQSLLGYSAFESGLTLMPRSLAMFVVMPIAGRFYNRLGPRVLVGSGLLVSAYSFWALSRLSLDVGPWDLVWPQVWQGVGFGLIFVALSTAALATIEKPRMTAASGLYNVVRQVAGSVGIAIAATQLTSSTTRYAAILGSRVGRYGTTATQWIARGTRYFAERGAPPGVARQRSLAAMGQELGRQASVLAYNHVFFLVVLVFLASFPLVFFLRPGSPDEAGGMMVE